MLKVQPTPSSPCYHAIYGHSFFRHCHRSVNGPLPTDFVSPWKHRRRRHYSSVGHPPIATNVTNSGIALNRFFDRLSDPPLLDISRERMRAETPGDCPHVAAGETVVLRGVQAGNGAAESLVVAPQLKPADRTQRYKGGHMRQILMTMAQTLQLEVRRREEETIDGFYDMDLGFEWIFQRQRDTCIDGAFRC